MPKRLHKRCQCFRPPINIQCKDCCCAVVPGPNFSPKEVHHVGILSTRNRRPKAQHSGCHLSRTETANRDGSNFSASQKHIDYRTWRGDILGPNCNTKAGKLFQKFQHRKGTQNIEYRAWCGAACRQGDEESQISDYARIKNRIEHGNRTSGVSFPGPSCNNVKGAKLLSIFTHGSLLWAVRSKLQPARVQTCSKRPYSHMKSHRHRTKPSSGTARSQVYSSLGPRVYLDPKLPTCTQTPIIAADKTADKTATRRGQTFSVSRNKSADVEQRACFCAVPGPTATTNVSQECQLLQLNKYSANPDQVESNGRCCRVPGPNCNASGSSMFKLFSVPRHTQGGREKRGEDQDQRDQYISIPGARDERPLRDSVSQLESSTPSLLCITDATGASVPTGLNDITSQRVSR